MININTKLMNSVSRKTITHDLLIIGVLAILVRIVLFFFFDYDKDFMGGDSGYYLEIGQNIISNGVHGENGVASFYRPPLYSFFAGLVANISKTAIFFNIIQSLLFVCFSFVVYFLLRHYGVKLAFWSALFIAVSPFDVLMNGRVLAENLVTPFIVLASLLFITARNSMARYFVSGALLGAAILCRDVYLLLPLLFLAVGALIKINGRYLSVYLLGCALMIAPWQYRNSQLTDGGIFLSQGIFWQNIWIGTWMRDWARDGQSMTAHPGKVPAEALRVYNNISPVAVSEAWLNNDQEFFKKIAIQYMIQNPISVIYTWATRYPLLWIGTRSDLNTTYLKTGNLAWYFMKTAFYLLNMIIIVLAIPGMFIALRSRSQLAVLCLPIFYNATIYIPLYNIETRYTLPVMPLLMIYSIYFVLFALEKWRGPQGWVPLAKLR